MYALTKINKDLLLFPLIFICAIGLAVILESYIIFILVSYFGFMLFIIGIIQKYFISLQTEKTGLKKQLADKSTELANTLEQLTDIKKKLVQT
ncbi:MAG: hypothetical protein IMF12_11025, partial [Proteobacteria bacterium]|nr:hypothetical protein [Pseudomonadota bacterium]